MNSFLKYTGIGLGVIILILGVITLLFLIQAGQFKSLEPQFAGSCSAIEGNGSAEDIVIDPETGFVYISDFDRLGSQSTEGLLGTVSIYDLNTNEARFSSPALPGPRGFHPHGLSLYKGSDGSKQLFVISHISQDEDTVELFDVAEDGSLSHVKEIMGDLLLSPNGIAAVGPRQFYIANDSGAAGGLATFLDMSFGIGTTGLPYYDGNTMRNVAEVPYGGGIDVSKDGKQIYYAATSKKQVLIFDRDIATGDVTLRHTVDLDSGVDNIRVAEDGALWVAGHSNTVMLISHFASQGQEPAPSHVFRIPMNNGDPGEPEEIYMNMGEEISAASVAAVFNGEMLLGSITAKKFLRCSLP